ncbi:MAG: hypothetical protein ACOH1Y_15800 [Propionicimonas sp.]
MTSNRAVVVGARALSAAHFVWEHARDNRRAAVMQAWADKHGYLFAPTCDLPSSWRGQGHGVNQVVGSVSGHLTRIFDVKTGAAHTGQTEGLPQMSGLASVAVLTVDGTWPAHQPIPADAAAPYQWRVEADQLVIWWPTTATPISMWTAANALAGHLGLTGRHPRSTATPPQSQVA